MKSNFFAWMTQFLVWFITAPLFRFFFKITVNGRENLINPETGKSLRGPLIIVANHISWYDSFFIRDALGILSPLLPIRFMASKKFHSPVMTFLYKIGIVPLVYFLFGVFTIVEGLGLSINLQNARRIIEDGGVIVMYPEGQINRGDELLKFKWGAAYLAIDESVPVLPMYIHSKYNGQTGKHELTANIGKPFVFSDDEDYGRGAEEMRGRVKRCSNFTS